jgi:hypothetical protein
MPVLLGAHVIIALLCAVHVIRTGREMYWIFILLAFPGLGSAAYVLTQVLPAAADSKLARDAGTAARKTLDPARESREALHQLEITRTPGNMHRAAMALLEIGKLDEALALMREATSGAYSEDSAMMLGLARAQFAGGHFNDSRVQLERLKELHPDLRLPDGHLLYARTLEALDRNDEALENFAAVSTYFPGPEARAHWAMLLDRLGRGDEAREQWAEIIAGARLAPAFTRKLNRKWIDMARARA